jgi:hypothetical protein
MLVELKTLAKPHHTRFTKWKSKWWFLRLVGTNMDKVNTYAFYELGEALSGLRQIKEGADRAEVFIALWAAEQSIEKFILESSDIALKLSRQAAQKLSDQCVSISDAAQPEWDKPILKHELSPVLHALTEFEAVFSNETQGLDVFSIKQKQAYSMTTLIERGEEVLPESIRYWLDEFTTNEIREATKCIAFDLPTAAGFHLLRGLESALRNCYDVLSNGEPRPKTKHGKDVPMGDYINRVEDLGCHEKTVALLRQIKSMYRDPHMHPEAVFSVDGSMMLLGIVTSAIWMMFKHLTDESVDLSDESTRDSDNSGEDEEAKAATN